MKQRSLENNTVDQLAQLMSIEAAAPLTWSEKDLAELLKHQLDAPLAVDLAGVAKSPDAIRQLKDFSAGEPGVTFLELLSRTNPPLEMLNLVKAFAKWAQAATEAAVPPDVGIVLYYAAIAAARVRLGKSLTQLADSDLSSGLAWVMQRTWLDSRLVSLFEAAQQ